MPFYEYKCSNCGIFEMMQSILDEPIKKCPKCNSEVEKIVSIICGIVIKGKEVNQYSDVLNAKYWRDKNGVRHKVTPADGHSGSSTVSKKTVSDNVVEKRKRSYKEADKQKRINLQKKIGMNRIKKIMKDK